jgi:DNA-binding response OmpR family regulator
MEQKLQVLMVDDDPAQLHVRELILRNAGFVSHVATSAESALALLRAMRERIGLVVTDHFLPGRNGNELVRDLRVFLPSTPVLVLSGMPDIESEYKGMGVSVLQKPCHPEELIRTVQGLLSSEAR